MPTFTPQEFGRAIGRLQDDLERELQQRTAMEMARRAQEIAEAAASNDLGGDPKFSGWAPSLETQVKRVRVGAVVAPTRHSAGPWTVAEQGRNQGNASGFAGPGINRRTGLTSRTRSGGLRKVRGSRARRWNGYTRGKGTASTAVAQMERELPKIAEKAARKITARRFDVT